MSAFDSIVLIAFGRPEKPEAHHYELISACSPLNELTFTIERDLSSRTVRGYWRKRDRDQTRVRILSGRPNWFC
jgi:hypothetical protein